MTVTHLDSGARHASCGRVLPLSLIETYMPTTPRLPKLRNFLLVLVLVCVVSCRPHAPASRQAAADPVAGLSLDVPATTFVLPNGLTVVVHEDHAAPLVAVTIWYHVGSQNEPPGKTGIAHLFDHLSFTGSEHLPTDFFTSPKKPVPTRHTGALHNARPPN